MLVIPGLNEEEGVGATIHRAGEVYDEIFIVGGGSRSNRRESAARIQPRHAFPKRCHRLKLRHLAPAMRSPRRRDTAVPSRCFTRPRYSLSVSGTDVPRRSGSRDLVTALAILAAAATLRAMLDCGNGPFGIDGSYYLQVARNVAEGLGVVTSVDLYHQALPALPAPTNIYPLWPLVLGGGMKLFGSAVAVSITPRILYVLALALLYLLSRTIHRALARESSKESWIGAPHLLLALFALTPVFWVSTTFPYTEGLAFSLTFGSLALLARATEVRLVLLSGVLGGLAYLTRSQMLLMVISVSAVMIVAASLDRTRWTRAFAFIGGAALPIALWLAWVSTFAPFSVRLLWANYRPTPQIAEYQQAIVHSSFIEQTIDRFRGIAVAFDPFSPYSFFVLFGTAAAVPLLALALSLGKWRRWRRAFDDELLVVTATIAAGVATAGILVTAHQRYFLPWLFGWRHGLVLILLIVVGTSILWHAGRATRTAVAAALLFSIATGAIEIAAVIRKGPSTGPDRPLAALTHWIDTNAPNAVFLATNAQLFAPYSGANFRWTACDSDPATTLQLLTLVPTDYVLVRGTERDCAFARGMGSVLEPVGVFGRGPDQIFLLRNSLARNR